MQIPTPEEVDYYKKKEIAQIVDKIAQLMRSGKFSFHPEESWSPHFSTLVNTFLAAGWSLSRSLTGDRESGGPYWTLKPRPSENYDR